MCYQALSGLWRRVSREGCPRHLEWESPRLVWWMCQLTSQNTVNHEPKFLLMMLSSVTDVSTDVCEVPWELWTDDITGISFWGFQFAFDKKKKWPAFHTSSSSPSPLHINFLELFYTLLFFFFSPTKGKAMSLTKTCSRIWYFPSTDHDRGNTASHVTDSFSPNVNVVYFCRSSSKLNMDSHDPRGGYFFTLERHICKSMSTLGEPTA